MICFLIIYTFTSICTCGAIAAIVLLDRDRAARKRRRKSLLALRAI
jgi:hypothetical protein